jgi:hypothetical protein
MKKLIILLAIITAAVHSPAQAPLPLVSAALNNFWPTNGGNATFQLDGYAQPSSGTNVLSVTLDGTNIFSSPPTTGDGGAWHLQGSLYFDGSNMNTTVQYITDDPSNRVVVNFSVITNANISGPVFEATEISATNHPIVCGSYIESLSLANGAIQAQMVVSPLKLPASLAFGDERPLTRTDVTNIITAMIAAAQIDGSQITPGTLNSASFDAPTLALVSGSGIFPSNAWVNVVSTITNSPNFSFGMANSNGVAFVDWYWSNNVIWVKQRMP